MTSTIATYYANTQARAADALFNSFDTNDVRKTNTMTATKSTLKYGKDSTRNSAGALDWIADPKVIRLSELYLIRAEALWQKGQYTAAADDIKKISQRAHLTTTVNITYSTPAELYKIIADERRRELCFEGFRLYDLGRRKESITRGADCIATKCTVNYPNARYVLPIPGKELDANRAMQPNPEIN
ncbi:MAG: RagB/SusD family nutrient uptake outer membrane protein [Filimonas sp.]|nr:RagB/SusD family nutrient uptake outer membrane protein [Filimonas sp.]